ncbi:solute carrier family 35 member G1 [Trichonephila clavata]|uniref:Solute carrier family 35 member G1 n=1 Tax=Trichonephila clavata TaxID=2740835 RepID=A0A8X6FLN3_TRICU|nr:solute carrier family 35 member G1 [Trichonephila clavata]
MKSRSKSFDLQETASLPKTSEKPKDNRFARFKGLLLGLFSGIFYSLVSVLVKDMKNLHPGQLSLYRFIAFLVCSMPQTVQCGENVLGPKKLRLILLIRGLLAGGHIFFNFIAFRYLPLGEATAIVFSLPVFVTVAARVFLKEPCSTFQSVTVVLTVLGIAFTAKLPSRLIGNPFMYSKDTIYSLLAAMLALCCNTVGYIGQTTLVIVLQLEYAGPVSTMKSASDIILAFIWQTFLFHEPPDLFSIIGAILLTIHEKNSRRIRIAKKCKSLPDNPTTNSPEIRSRQVGQAFLASPQRIKITIFQ